MSLGLRPTSLLSGILIHAAIWPQKIWSENRSPHLGERKLGLNVTQRGQGRGLPATCMQSFILIRPAVWPQYTNVTDRSGQTEHGQTWQTTV